MGTARSDGTTCAPSFTTLTAIAMTKTARRQFDPRPEDALRISRRDLLFTLRDSS